MARPRQFDPDAGLEKAMRLFWKNGYTDTSIGQLTAELGINRPSLYAAFGDKANLFLMSLDHYHATITSNDRSNIKTANSPNELIDGILTSCVDRISRPGYPAGCLVSGAVSDLSSLDKNVANAVQDQLRGFETLIANKLNELGISKDMARAKASAIVTVIIGLGSYARHEHDRKKLSLLVEQFKGL